MVLASLARIEPAGKYAKGMVRDSDFLLQTRLPDGRWTYVPLAVAKRGKLNVPPWTDVGDNSNTQFAVLALREAAVSGAPVPQTLWPSIRKYWQNEQRADGGFDYRSNNGPGSSGHSYGSMTAAGVASLFIAEDMMRNSRCCVGDIPESISRAMEWLSAHFDAYHNPERPSQFWTYWLYGVERVAEMSGYRFLGTHDWFWEGSTAIVEGYRQNRLSDFPEAKYAGKAFSLVFLAKGVAPMVCNKMDFGGGWNPNPLDATHMTRYLSTDVFERHLNWQIIRLDAPLSMFHEAPLLLITTKTWPGQGDPLANMLGPRIYEFCETGGTVLIDPTCSPNKEFAPRLEAFLRKFWPDRSLHTLPASSPLYTAHFRLEGDIRMRGLGNGCRDFILLCEGKTEAKESGPPQDPAGTQPAKGPPKTTSSRPAHSRTATCPGRPAAPPARSREDSTCRASGRRPSYRSSQRPSRCRRTSSCTRRTRHFATDWSQEASCRVPLPSPAKR